MEIMKRQQNTHLRWRGQSLTLVNVRNERVKRPFHYADKHTRRDVFMGNNLRVWF